MIVRHCPKSEDSSDVVEEGRPSSARADSLPARQAPKEESSWNTSAGRCSTRKEGGGDSTALGSCRYLVRGYHTSCDPRIKRVRRRACIVCMFGARRLCLYVRLCRRASLCLEEREACVCQVPANDALLSLSRSRSLALAEPVRRYATAGKNTDGGGDRQTEEGREGGEGG